MYNPQKKRKQQKSLTIDYSVPVHLGLIPAYDPQRKRKQQKSMTIYSTCASGSDASICGTIHCVGQHLLQKQGVVGHDGGCEVRLHLFCHL